MRRYAQNNDADDSGRLRECHQERQQTGRGRKIVVFRLIMIIRNDWNNEQFMVCSTP
jgi:hypothetical protein